MSTLAHSILNFPTEYADALEGFMQGGGEQNSLQQAYNFGRRALHDGFGVVDLSEVHHQALKRLLVSLVAPEEIVRVMKLADEFFAESLSAFELVSPYGKEGNRLSEEMIVRLEWLLSQATEDRETDVALLQRVQREFFLSERLRSLGVLARGMAHQFEELLETIDAYAQRGMAKEGEDFPAARELSLIRGVCESGINMVRHLAGFAAVEARGSDYTDFNQIIRDFAEMILPLLGPKYSIVMELSPRVQDWQGDVALIRQVLMNLINNAKESMPEGGQIRIGAELRDVENYVSQTCRTFKTGRYVCLSVCDQGFGMNAQTLEHIFRPFFTTKSRENARGLGLTLVSVIAIFAGGWVEVESVVGQGSLFRVFFPISAMSE